ncbi:PREDICTED: FBD-associated F-box protein At5g22730-like [Camelina sativa]|uniref:FBD-associated F-box protein At5g22730-like n=1 Tax=Camelina sativa TaxID=90675 RepID=A0ABM1REG2_CAMSA|nr:PREDICTED: FBD-associated F-box protein At5g22730-like [Camelina sativa]
MEEEFLRYLKAKRREWPPSRYISGREDLISKLPDSLILQILLYLPTTKEAVRTSVLSTRWKSLWLLIPNLDLDSSKFPDYNAFVGFMDKFLDFSREHKSCLHKLKLCIHKGESDQSCVTRWLDFVVRRKLKHLDVECLVNRKFLEEMPLSLYVCDTLVYLRLHRVSLGEFESVSLTSLKTMRLEENVYANDVVLESLISSCPVLQDLSILRMVKDNVKVLRVRSQTLTSLRVDFHFGEGDDYDDFDKKVSGVFIDAPRLEYLKFEDDLSNSKIITNSGSLAKVNLVYVFNESDCADVADLPKRNMVRTFLTSISGVRDMKMADGFVEFLYYNIVFDPLPHFCNLSCLKAEFSLHYLEILPTVLESCPHLKSLVLVLEFDPSREDVQISFSSVPRCLVSSLEFVEIKYFNGGPAKMEVARYFVENSRVLKKLVLHLRCSSHQEGFYMLKDLLELPRGSSTCRIIVC